MPTPNGLLLWSGASLLDGSPIALIATGLGRRSANEKTGNMVQTYIIRTDVDPVSAVKSGADKAVCGDCKHASGGSCYVNVGHGPLAVFKAYHRGTYPAATDDQVIDAGAGRMVRVGTYGDPAAVPADVWALLLMAADGWTGYTHQWHTARGVPLRSILMASVDTLEEAGQAISRGWRTFRVRTEAQDVTPGEFVCPASEEAGKRTTCAQCGACDGAHRGTSKASPVIIAHGSKARRFIAIATA